MVKTPYVEFHYQKYLEDTKYFAGATQGACIHLYFLLCHEKGKIAYVNIDLFCRQLSFSPEELIRYLCELMEENVFTIHFPQGSFIFKENEPRIIEVGILKENKSYAW